MPSPPSLLETLFRNGLDPITPYRVLADSIPQMVWLLRADGQISFGNARFCNFFGWNYCQTESPNDTPRSDLDQRAYWPDDWSWTDALHPSDAARWRQLWSQICDRMPTEHLDVRLRCHDGSYQWLSLNISPLLTIAQKNVTQQIVGWSCVGTDIEVPATHELGTTTTCDPENTSRNFPTSRLDQDIGQQCLVTDICVAGLGLADVDYATGVIHLSTEAARIFGVGNGPMTIPRLAIHDLFHPEDRQELLSRIARSLDPKGPGWFDMDHRIVRPNGETRWLRVRKQIRFTVHEDAVDEHGRACRRARRAGLAVLDVTNEKNATVAVQESSAFVRGILNSLPEQIVVLDDKGIICEVNESWERFYRENSHETATVSLGVDYLEICRRASREGDGHATSVLSKLEAILAGTLDKCIVEYPCHTPNRQRWFLMYAQRLQHGHHGMILSHVDITQHKLAEEQLRITNERFEAALQTSQIVVFNQDLDLKYTWIHNPALGFQSSEVIGKRDVDLFPRTADADRTESLKQQVIDDGVGRRREVTVCNGETEQHFDLMIQPQRNAHGQVVGITCTAVDITERKLAEAALLEQDKRKDVFLATLAHELRNPLAPIRTGLELMKLVQHDRQLLEDVRQTMERQTQQLVTIVNDLLDVSRITQGKLQLRKSDVILADVIRSAVEACQPFLDAGKHQLTILTPESPIYLHADPNRLAQVLSNLLSNAAKFTLPMGHITLKAEQFGDDLQIEVRDNGIGIPAEMHHGVFEMFTQASPADERNETGLGIGLSLVKSLITMHGGTIDVRSDGVNQGSTFTLRLPIPTEGLSLTPSPPPLAEEIPKVRLRVLVVDDNLAAATTLSLVIKMLGNEVRTASDGREACAVATEFRPDIIMSDIGMPKMDGCEAAKWIRQQAWGADIMLVALTGWGQENDRARTKAAGFDHHLVKPAEPTELERLLALATGRRTTN